MRVLIQGAGPAGLTLALALARAGHEPRLIDRAPPGRDEGYAVGLSGAGWRAMEKLDLIERLKARRIPLGEARYLRADGAPHLAYDYRRIDAALGGRMMAILREDLQGVLREAALEAGLEIRHGLWIEALTQDAAGVDLRLNSGEAARFDLVFGADGYRSGLRRLLFPEVRPELLGYRVAAWRHVPSRPLAASVIGMAEIDLQATLYALPEGAAATLFCWRDSGEGRLSAEAKRALLLERFGGWPDPVAEALETADWERVFLDEVGQIHAPRWFEGRVALLGDAAWHPAFLSGQGAAMATAGALLLAEALAKAPHEAAFAAWEARLRPAVARQQKASRRIGGQYVPASAKGLRMQKLLAPLLFSRLLLPLAARRMTAGPEFEA